uniref:Uncharacterized protein n=1 Tax=Ciona intestinalis TaxID=7719 RepID=H2Y1B3_CIOIN
KEQTKKYLHPALFSAGQRRYFFVCSFKRRLHYRVARLGVKRKKQRNIYTPDPILLLYSFIFASKKYENHCGHDILSFRPNFY